MTAGTIRVIRQAAKPWSKETSDVEIGGVLVGQVRRDERGPYVEVETTIDALEAATILPNYLTADYCALYAATKRGELDTFKKTISPQEYDWYL